MPQVVHTPLEFSSVLRLAEEVFNLPPPRMMTARVITTIYACIGLGGIVYSSDDPCGHHPALALWDGGSNIRRGASVGG